MGSAVYWEPRADCLSSATQGPILLSIEMQLVQLMQGVIRIDRNRCKRATFISAFAVAFTEHNHTAVLCDSNCSGTEHSRILKNTYCNIDLQSSLHYSSSASDECQQKVKERERI